MVKLNEEEQKIAMRIGTIMLMTEQRYSMSQIEEAVGLEYGDVIQYLYHTRELTKYWIKIHESVKRRYFLKNIKRKLGL